MGCDRNESQSLFTTLNAWVILDVWTYVFLKSACAFESVCLYDIAPGYI